MPGSGPQTPGPEGLGSNPGPPLTNYVSSGRLLNLRASVSLCLLWGWYRPGHILRVDVRVKRVGEVQVQSRVWCDRD